MTSVLIVDDHALVRAGLAALLASAARIEVVGVAADGREGVELASRLRPDVVLMDLSMPVLDGLAATRLIAELAPTSRVVVLTSSADRHRATQALAAGAVGYLLKDCDPNDIIATVRAAATGVAQLPVQLPRPRWHERVRQVPRQAP
jgi:DNA-binding NarL/FixJ family response regulator